MTSVPSLKISDVIKSLFVAWGTNGTASRTAQSERVYPGTLEWYTNTACATAGNAQEAHMLLNSRLVEDGFVIKNGYVIDMLDSATKISTQKSTVPRLTEEELRNSQLSTAAVNRTNATESVYSILFSRSLTVKLRVRNGAAIFKGGKSTDDVMAVTFDNPFVVSRWDATSISNDLVVQILRPVPQGTEDGSIKYEVISNDVVSLSDPEGKCVGFVREVILPMLVKLCIRWNNLCTVASNKLVTARSDFFYRFYPLSKIAKGDVQAWSKVEIVEHLSIAAARYTGMLDKLTSDEALSKVPMANALPNYVKAVAESWAVKSPQKQRKQTVVKQFNTFPRMSGHGEVILSAPVVRSLTIAELLQMLEDGSLIVPDFQRHFVWKATDMRQFIVDILASNGDEFVTDFFTIGVEVESRDEAGLGYLEHTVDSDSSMKLLINGLQRLSTAQSFVNNTLALPPESFGTVMGDVEIHQLKQLLEDLKQGGGSKGVARIKFNTLPTYMQERFLGTKMPVVFRAGDHIALGGLFTRLNLGKPLLTSQKMFSPATFGAWFGVLKKFIIDSKLFGMTFPAPSKTASPERIAAVSEAKLLNMVASYFGTFSGEPSADMTAIVAKLLRNNTEDDAEMFVSIMNNMLDYVFEVDCDTQVFNEVVTKNDKVLSMNRWCMATPGWYRWVMFVRFSTAFITVLKNFAETSGGKYDITKSWKTEFPFIYEQREKVAACINAMVNNGVQTTWDSVSKKLINSTPSKGQSTGQRVLSDTFATHLKPLALPFNDEDHWKSFVDAMELPAYSISDSASTDFPLDDYATYVMSVAEDTDTSVLETIASVKLNEFSYRFITGGNEDTCLRIMQDIPTNVGEHTNGSAVHIALHRYFNLVVFGLVV